MATVVQRGRTWQLNWSDAAGQHRLSLGKIARTEAQIRLREKELELLTGRNYSASATTLAAFSVDYLNWYASQYPSTYDRVEAIFRLQLVPEFGLRDIDQINVYDVTKWITKRQQTAKPGTVVKEARALQAILNRAVQWKVIPSHALADYDAPAERSSKPPLYYTPAQMAALYAARPRYADIWKLMVNTGLRRNEALFLLKSDVLDGRLVVRSEEDRPTKTREWREVPTNERATAALEALMAASSTDYVLPRMEPPSLSRAFVGCSVRANLPGSLHTLRHTFISQMVMAGVDLPTVKKIAGHARIETTMKYIHLSPLHAQTAVQKIAL